MTAQYSGKADHPRRFSSQGSRPVISNIGGLRDVPYLTSDLLTGGEPEELWASDIGCGLYRSGVGADVSTLWFGGHDCTARRAVARPRMSGNQAISEVFEKEGIK